MVRRGVIDHDELQRMIEGTIAPPSSATPQRRWRLATELLGDPVYERLVDRYVNELTPEDLLRSTTIEVLTALDQRTALHPENRRKVADWLTLSRWVVDKQRMEFPSRDPHGLTSALQRLFPAGVTARFWHQTLRPAIVQVGSDRPGSAELIARLAPLLGCSAQELYLQLYSERLRIAKPVGPTIEAPMAFMVHAASLSSLGPPLDDALILLRADYESGMLGRVDPNLGRFASAYLADSDRTRRSRKPARPFEGTDFVDRDAPVTTDADPAEPSEPGSRRALGRFTGRDRPRS
jgi:hypothetical protein